jgi:uncharacterized membrane protein (UPF0127 family)
MKIQRQLDQRMIVENGRHADTYFSRLVGWIGKRQAQPGEGLLITPCNSVHMWMMSLPIDVVFLSREMKIVKAVPNLRPWKLLPVFCPGAESALELPAGTIAAHQLRDGEVLCIA